MSSPDESGRLSRALGLFLIAAVATACTGGVPCPETSYSPSGQHEADCETGRDACLDQGETSCWVACGAPCDVSGCSCEPCADVRSWAAEECPDCLREDEPRIMSISCTTE